MNFLIFLIIFSLAVIIFFSMEYVKYWFLIDLRNKIG
jgi:hypothetical protein